MDDGREEHTYAANGEVGIRDDLLLSRTMKMRLQRILALGVRWRTSKPHSKVRVSFEGALQSRIGEAGFSGKTGRGMAKPSSEAERPSLFALARLARSLVG